MKINRLSVINLRNPLANHLPWLHKNKKKKFKKRQYIQYIQMIILQMVNLLVDIYLLQS